MFDWIPVCTGMENVTLPRKWESSGILCRLKGDSLSYWIPVCTGMGRGRGAQRWLPEGGEFNHGLKPFDKAVKIGSGFQRAFQRENVA